MSLPHVSSLSIYHDPTSFCGDGAPAAKCLLTPSPSGSRAPPLPHTKGLVILASNPALTCGGDPTTTLPEVRRPHVSADHARTRGAAADAGLPDVRQLCVVAPDANAMCRPDDERYLPAYELRDGAQERLGRARRPPTGVPVSASA
jgi:hypothetical protein